MERKHFIIFILLIANGNGKECEGVCAHLKDATGAKHNRGDRGKKHCGG